MRKGQPHTAETRAKIAARMTAFHEQRKRLQRIYARALAEKVSSDLLDPLQGLDPERPEAPVGELDRGDAPVLKPDVQR